MKGIRHRLLKVFMSGRSILKLRDFLKSLRMDYTRRLVQEPAREMPDLRPPLKLQVGSGSNLKQGWINIDLDPAADLRVDVRQGLPFDDNSAEIIYSEHFLEHLEYPLECADFLRESLRVLRPGGLIHVGVPDSRYVVESCLRTPIRPEFLEAVKKHGWGYPEWCRTGFEYINYHFRLGGLHKFAFDAETLVSQLQRCGFVNVRERPFDISLDMGVRAAGTLYVVAEKPLSL